MQMPKTKTYRVRFYDDSITLYAKSKREALAFVVMYVMEREWIRARFNPEDVRFWSIEEVRG